MLRRSDAGPHEDGRAAERAGGQDDLACRDNLAIDELHADSTLAVDNYSVHFSVTADGEVGESADCIREISHPRVDSHTIDDIERIGTHTILGRAIEIRYVGQADGFRGLNEGAHRRGIFLRRPLADGERAAAAVPGVIPSRRILQSLVRCEDFLPRPSLDSALRPTREVGRSRTHRYTAIDCRTAADYSAAGNGDIVAESGGVFGVVVPIEGGRASDDIRVIQNRWIIGGCKIRACFKQDDTAACIVAKSGCKN